MNSWLIGLAAVLGGIVGSAGLAPIILAVARRRPIQAEAEVSLSEGALKWVAEFQEETHAARLEAAAARTDTLALHSEVRTIRREAEEVSRYLLRVLRWIEQPGMDIDRLRTLVAQDDPPLARPR